MKRVVVTGMGVLAPNAHGLDDFERALREGRSGVRRIRSLEERGFQCQVGAIPQGVEELKKRYFTEEQLFGMNSHMIYAGVAAIDAWRDAGLEVPALSDARVDWDTCAIIGTSLGGIDSFGEQDVHAKVVGGQVRRLGSTLVEQTMFSAASARITGLLGLGGQVTANGNACTTGIEAVIEGLRRVRDGRATRALLGSCEGASETSAPYVWAAFEASRALARGFNEEPARASRPLSASATGYVPGAGAGMLVLEELESARARGARIHCEVLGGSILSGAQREGGTLGRPNPRAVVRCIRSALTEAGVEEIDLVNGHLVGSRHDHHELGLWEEALGRLPVVQSTKSMIGNTLAAAGGIETVACALQLERGFIHGSLNCEDLHASVAHCVERIPAKALDRAPRIVMKGSFGFGDSHAALVLRRWEGN